MTYEEALAAFEGEPPIQVLFEEGAADGQPPLDRRSPGSSRASNRGRSRRRSWPAGTSAADGTPRHRRSGRQRASRVRRAIRPASRRRSTTATRSDLWRTDVVWDWQEPAAGTVATFASPPLTDTAVMVGSALGRPVGQLRPRRHRSRGDAQRGPPRRQEVYVQRGWLRASHRALDEAASTEQRPVQTHLEADAEPLPDGVDEPGSRWRGSRSSRSPTCSEPDRRSASRSTRRVATGRCGRSRRSPTARSCSSASAATTRRRSCCPSFPASNAPRRHRRVRSLRGQPCRTPVLSTTSRMTNRVPARRTELA